MSDLQIVIRKSLRNALESAFRKELNSDPRNYPGGIEGWVDSAVEMRMNEIGEWLFDPAEVRKHLEELERTM